MTAKLKKANTYLADKVKKQQEEIAAIKTENDELRSRLIMCRLEIVELKKQRRCSPY